ncbi:carboxypeptidase B-like [Hyposmocoma kahamanoa]|uniref:carboxypeptidase B-like n=1 Tax=Hyposmocoma kahamanoa TaxID=1477025 RepID=UPI000E6D63CC|nr:carboxypeptidase B-like [Hyposmocoma kahamanoa]
MILFPPRNYELSGAKIRTKRDSTTKIHYPQYLDYEKVVKITERFEKADSDVVYVRHLTPNTTENRSIVALELHSDKLTKKPGILIIGGLNGMTWAVPNAIFEIAEKLLYDTGYQTPFFNDYDWYLIPLANPDGMHFTTKIRDLPPVDTPIWSTNFTARIGTRPSQWHKNVEKKDKESCFGTNVNRNFAYHWQDDVHKTPDRCSQFYAGAKPFSSFEAQALKHYFNGLSDSSINLAIHLHASFVPRKELILYPWRFSKRQPSNYATLQAIGEYAARQARLPDGRLYEVHQSSTDGRVAGSVCDYISGVVGTELVYLVKPYFPAFPNYTDTDIIENYVNRALTATLGLVRGWRRSTKLNTLYFFGKEIEF